MTTEKRDSLYCCVTGPVWKWFRRYLIIGCAVALWCAVLHFQVLDETWLAGISMWVGAGLFLLGVPLSLFAHVDTIADQLHLTNPLLALLVTYLIALANALLLSGVWGVCRWLKLRMVGVGEEAAAAGAEQKKAPSQKAQGATP